MLELRDAVQMRRKHAADRSGIRSAVGVSSDVPEDGTDIQTRPTTNAVQYLALFRIGQQLAASVVDQHHMEFVRSIRFALAPRTADQRAIRSNALPRAGS